MGPSFSVLSSSAFAFPSSVRKASPQVRKHSADGVSPLTNPRQSCCCRVPKSLSQLELRIHLRDGTARDVRELPVLCARCSRMSLRDVRYDRNCRAANLGRQSKALIGGKVPSKRIDVGHELHGHVPDSKVTMGLDWLRFR